MDVTYIFTSYISITIRRQARAFYYRNYRITYYENEVFIDENKFLNDFSSNSTKKFPNDFGERFSYRELIFEGLNSLSELDKHIILEKILNLRTNADIGNELNLSGQAISKRKKNIIEKLKNLFLV